MAIDRRAFLRSATALAGALAVLDLPPEPVQSQQLPPQLAVFVATELATRAVQKLLEDALPGTRIIVFGRYRDFENALTEKPESVLASQTTLKQAGLPITVSGTARGSTIEPHSLLAIGKSADPKTVGSVGVVDILGRQGMKALVTELLGSAPRVERVAKVLDLLPLLQLGSVEAVLTPERLVRTFQDQSRLDLRATPLSGGIGLPGLSVLRPSGEAIAQKLRRLSPDVSQKLGVSEWR